MLQILAELRLVALLQHNSVWLAVEPRVAWLLDVCCMGQKDGGPGTAREVAAVLGLQLATRQEVHAAAAAASPAPMVSCTVVMHPLRSMVSATFCANGQHLQSFAACSGCMRALW